MRRRIVIQRASILGVFVVAIAVSIFQLATPARAMRGCNFECQVDTDCGSEPQATCSLCLLDPGDGAPCIRGQSCHCWDIQ